MLGIYVSVCTGICIYRAGGNGQAPPVLAGTVFSQGESRIPFLQKAGNRQSASVIFGLIILDGKSISRGTRLLSTHALCLQGFLLCKGLGDEQSGSVIFDLLDL